MDLRTKEGRAARPEYVERVCELRFKGWTFDLIAEDLGITPATASALAWDGLGLQSVELTRKVESDAQRNRRYAEKTRRYAERKRWIIETDPETDEFRVLYNGVGKAITDPAEAEIELELWIAMQEGTVECVGFDADNNALWRSPET